jgi:hypothetical protein
MPLKFILRRGACMCLNQRVRFMSLYISRMTCGRLTADRCITELYVSLWLDVRCSDFDTRRSGAM